ncbi:MAG TPA: anti-sigma factor [Acidimicrobiales bacterium]|nr:anti-sigma factor [Acidimicrobiales bacterium]
MRTSQHERIQELLGVYAADAVEPSEAKEVERHLQTCAECQAEVTEHRETLALLAPAKSQLRLPAFNELGLDLSTPLASVTPLRAPKRTVPAWTMSVAAALVFLVAAVAVTQARRADDLSTQLARSSTAAVAAQALADPAARRLTLETESGEALADVALLADGRGYLVPRDLPELSADQTYQLWALKGPERTSLVVAGSRPEVLAFRASPDIDGLALTQEVAGGVPQPTKNPVAVAFLRAA